MPLGGGGFYFKSLLKFSAKSWRAFCQKKKILAYTGIASAKLFSYSTKYLEGNQTAVLCEVERYRNGYLFELFYFQGSRRERRRLFHPPPGWGHLRDGGRAAVRDAGRTQDAQDVRGRRCRWVLSFFLKKVEFEFKKVSCDLLEKLRQARGFHRKYWKF